MLNAKASGSSKGPAKVIRARYREATRSFLNADFLSCLRSLSAALDALPQASASPSWTDLLDAPASSLELSALDQRRKVIILYVTVIATCYTNQKEISGEAKSHELLSDFLVLKAEVAVSRLFYAALARFDPSVTSSDELPLPSPAASRLPPSVVVALALGALKMQAPRAAKAIVEAWLGSMNEAAESALEAEGESLDASPDSSMTSSGLSLSMTPAESSGSARRDALMSYERILEVYALHVLPALNAWDEADEWIRLLSRDNGGWTRNAKVEWLSVALKDMKAARAEAAEQQHQRAVAQAEHDKEMKKQKARKSKKRTVNGSGSDEHSSSSNSPPKVKPALLATSPPPPDPEPVVRRPPANISGFAAMRNSLADFLRPRPPGGVGRPAENGLERFARILMEQSRLLSFVAFLFAFVTWRRRSNRTLRESAEAFWTKVKETVGMATSASYL